MESERYLNPDPLVWLIGEANETTVKLEKQNFKALVDSGSMVSQVTLSLAKKLHLKIHQLSTILPMEGAAGVKVPYLGYVEALLNIPEVPAFEEDCLFLVVPDHNYGERVPITIGTLHIDMIIEKATPEQLDKISIAWGRGQLFRQIQARQVQLENKSKLDEIKGEVRLTRKVKLKPNETKTSLGRSNHPLNEKRVNVIVEPSDGEGSKYTVPSYTYIKQNSRRVSVGLRNLSCRTITLSKGTVVATLSPAKKIPKT
ncbi:MAG: retropepsin-like domain-containing protein, partial [Proteobacteria bacterium]|nr:retropepsin-like domain-containing protein [Pseudomonadota bacterium]